MLKNYLIKVSGLLLCISSLGTSVYAGVATDSTVVKSSDNKPETVLAVQEQSSLNKYLKSIKFTPVGDEDKFGFLGSKKLGLFKNDINVSGTVRFVSIFRNMGDAYGDMTTSKRNLSLADNPIVGGGSAAGSSGFPMVDLLFSSKINRQSDFIIAYSYSHFMSGIESKTVDNTRFLSSVQNLRVAGNYYTDFGKFSFQAGSILPVKLNKFSMGQIIYRDDYFDRLPWDWYRSTFTRYEEYYGLKNNMGGQNEGRALFYGTMLNGSITPLGINMVAVYGRGSNTSPIAMIGVLNPAIVYGGRLEKTLFGKKANGKVSINYYKKESDISSTIHVPDNNTMAASDFEISLKGIKFSGEIAYGMIENTVVPLSSPTLSDVRKNDGFAYQLKLDISKKILPLPIILDGYYINKNVASTDGSIMNTNPALRAGGLGTKADNSGLDYDGSIFTNVVQEIGQYANNRMGLTLKTDFKIGKLSVDFAVMATQEIEKTADSVVTVQHRVNSFTRSRMNPYYNQVGPYSRVRSIFRRTFESVKITEASDNQKSFNAAETWVMYKGKVFGKGFVFMTYHTYNTALSHINWADNFTDDAYTRMYYGDATLVFKALSKVAIVANAGYEKLLGGKGTIMTTADRDGVAGKTINQTGKSLGFGIDYEFIANAGIHLRHKWFDHKDENFRLDKFNGTETTLEFKYFF